MLPGLIAKGWQVIIAPHDVDAKRIHYLQTALGQRAITFSAVEKEGIKKQDVLIIDNVGLLAHIYKYTELAYIGGGFGKGIHNILEAAASGLPVIIGPNYRKFKEAKDLIDLGGAFSIKNTAELETLLNELLTEEPYFTAANAAQQYVQDNAGATQKVMQWVKENAEN
jgi:3-deoxy-D-manno-octulosonic-acid transferase